MKTLICLLLCVCLLTVSPARAGGPSKGALVVPAISLYEPLHPVPIIGHSYDTSQLQYGAGWLEGTNWVTDGWGTVVLVGHTPGGFEDIYRLRPGDELLVVPHDGQPAIYRVTALHHAVPVGETDWLAPSLGAGQQLLLITCEGPDRLIVQAERVNK